jgi:hypothetical protein
MAPDMVVVEPRRGLHESGARRVRSSGERTRVVFVALTLVALVVVLTAALAPLRGRRPLVQPRPIPAAVSQPPLVPAPPTPPASGAAPPGFPTAIPTAVSPTPEPEHPPVRTVAYEAESAANSLSGAATVREVPGASGGLVVTSIGSGQASTLGFTSIVVPAAGTYTLTVFYVSAADTAAAIRVDGVGTTAVAFPATGGDEEVASLALRIRLVAGRNTIVFGNPAADAPDIDRITIGN